MTSEYLDRPKRAYIETLAEAARGAARLHRKMSADQADLPVLLSQLRRLRQIASLLVEEADAEIRRIQGVT